MVTQYNMMRKMKGKATMKAMKTITSQVFNRDLVSLITRIVLCFMTIDNQKLHGTNYFLSST